jgi:hypothetical protein
MQCPWQVNIVRIELGGMWVCPEALPKEAAATGCGFKEGGACVLGENQSDMRANVQRNLHTRPPPIRLYDVPMLLSHLYGNHMTARHKLQCAFGDVMDASAATQKSTFTRQLARSRTPYPWNPNSPGFTSRAWPGASSCAS